MKNKITALLVLLTLFLSINAGAFYDITADNAVADAVLELSKLGIISGYPDGSFKPDETLTRAQFAKIAVHMLGEEKNAAARSAGSFFGDVEAGSWASGYINYIAELEIINGYPDGTFGADETITYAQALTILVRLLGYSGEDVSFRWPDGYIDKAAALGITKNMSFGKYENVTRANAAYLAYNTILADAKESGSNKILGMACVEDVVIYGDAQLNASIPSGHILTTGGTYKLSDSSGIAQEDYGITGTLYIDDEKRAVSFVKNSHTKRNVTITSAANNTDSGKVEITFEEGGRQKTESFSALASLYYDGVSTSLSSGVTQMEAGREAGLIYDAAGNLTGMLLKKSALEGPRTYTGSTTPCEMFGISANASPKVLRNGERAELSDIAAYDVLYYTRSINTLYAYSDKITGIYEKANPIKANVASVIVAGNEYTLATQTAINKMNESDNAYRLGERVSLLLGRNGDVVDVVRLSDTGALDIVVVTDAYSEISEKTETKGQKQYYLTVVMSDGNSVTYEADKDYSDYIGSVVKLIYDGEKVKIGPAASSKNISGEFDASVPSLGGHWLTSDCVILELLEKTENKSATVKKIEVRDILLTKLSDKNVLYVNTTGETRDINFLYVKNVTKSASRFGVVTAAEKSNYTILTGDTEHNVSTALKLKKGDAVEISPEGAVTYLQKIVSAPSIEGYSSGKIRIGSTTYPVSDYVKIYGGRQAEEFRSMSAEEMLDKDTLQMVTLYSDQTIKNGGIIRAIVVKTK